MSDKYYYLGETGTAAFDGMAGFRIGHVYELQLGYPAADQVTIGLPHGSPGAGPLLVTAAQFARWFRKQQVTDLF